MYNQISKIMKTFKTLHPNSKSKINLEEIVRIEADINYSHLILSSGGKLIIARTLKAYEKELSIPFLRVNKSCMINMHFLEKESINKKLVIRLVDGFQASVSRRRIHYVVDSIARFKQ